VLPGLFTLAQGRLGAGHRRQCGCALGLAGGDLFGRAIALSFQRLNLAACRLQRLGRGGLGLELAKGGLGTGVLGFQLRNFAFGVFQQTLLGLNVGTGLGQRIARLVARAMGFSERGCGFLGGFFDRWQLTGGDGFGLTDRP
jgi:hypothetical protein